MNIIEKNPSRARCEIIAEYLIRSKCTVREAASYFKISKSTVHKDVTDRIKQIDPQLYKKVRKVLNKNKAERHLRGGNATKLKFSNRIKI